MAIIQVSHNDQTYAQVLALRQLILRDPLKMTFSQAELAHDRQMVYFAYIEGDEVLGVVGMERMPEGRAQLRQMAVHSKLQGKGVGRQLVISLENFARDNDFKEVHLDSRYEARGFYARLGYQEYGEIYQKIGLEHINMKKKLS